MPSPPVFTHTFKEHDPVNLYALKKPVTALGVGDAEGEYCDKVLAPQSLGSSGQRGINRKVTTHKDRAVAEASRTPLGAQAREP